MIYGRVGAYRIEKKLKATSSASHYLAHHSDLGHKAIVTVLAASYEAEAQAVLQQARQDASLEHPNIIQTYVVDRTPEGYVYSVTAYLVGETLEERLRRQEKLSWQQAFNIAKQLLGALEYAHSHGVVHRMLKPNAVFITRKGLVKLCALGESRFTVGSASHTIWGDTAYMSPQKLLGAPSHSYDDIWSWAVIFYEMLTGRKPFAHHDLGALVQAIIYDKPYGLVQALQERERATPYYLKSLEAATSNQPPATLVELLHDILEAKGKGYDSSAIAATLHTIGRKHQEASLHQPLSPHNLYDETGIPASVLASLCGRDESLEELRLLVQEQHLVAVIAMAGVGKTHILQHVAYLHLMERNFSAGVYYLDLASMHDTTVLAHALIAIWGKEASREDTTASTSDTMSAPDTTPMPDTMSTPDKQHNHAPENPWHQVLHLYDSYHADKGTCLLILDNIEHLDIDDAIALLLNATSSLHIALGSRHSVSPEAAETVHSYHLAPFALPPLHMNGGQDGDEAHTNFFRTASYQLFIERAKKYIALHDISATERSAIVEICHHFSGLALGIVWAAAWLDSLKPSQILHKLCHEEGFLGQTRVIPARHSSPWEACQASWKLLTAREQQALYALSHLAASFSYAEACQLTEVDIVMLKTLMNKSVLLFNTEQAHYYLPPLWQRFARAQKVAQLQYS